MRKRFGSVAQFTEFCGWLHQDSGDNECAMYWTERSLEYAIELMTAVSSHMCSCVKAILQLMVCHEREGRWSCR